jgi:hypothetical protein
VAVLPRPESISWYGAIRDVAYRRLGTSAKRTLSTDSTISCASDRVRWEQSRKIRQRADLSIGGGVTRWEVGDV